MKLVTPCQSPDFIAQDIAGRTIQLSNYIGRPVVLSFFRDAGCPFCNMRVFEYTQKHAEWDALGIIVIAVFSSSSDEIREFVSRNPRPFITIGDPELNIYQRYGIEQSLWGLFKALIFKLPTIVRGYQAGAEPDRRNPNGKLIPADFLIAPNGQIIDSWYGRNASDHMPMKRMERFVEKVRVVRRKQMALKRAELVQQAA